MYILGLSRHHDSAAALLKDGEIIALAEEERFNRRKHFGGFPTAAVRYCLDQAGITLGEVDHVAYFWQRWPEVLHGVKHFVRYAPGTFAVLRPTRTADGRAPRGLLETLRADGEQRHHDDYDVGGALLLHIKRTFTLRQTLRSALAYTGPLKFQIHLVDHHLAHAASAFMSSPFGEAAIFSVDGLGSDGTCTLLGVGRGTSIRELRRVKFPHSLGALYSTITGYLGFSPTRDEGKVMGLAPYGTDRYVAAFKDLVQLGPEGTYQLNLSWFQHHLTGKHLVSQRFLDAFGPARPKGPGDVSQHYADIAYALQRTLEDTGLHIARWLQATTGLRNVCLSGGVALNSVMNGRILLETEFTDFFAPPACSDAGTAVGAAQYVAACTLGLPRPTGDYVYLGPDFSTSAIETALIESGVDYERPTDIAAFASERIAAGEIIGWFQGRMEAGPRALGNRSILADPRDPASKARLNEKIKHREPFRPFAPSVLLERAGEYFASDYPSPVMLLVYAVHDERRAEVPAITHVDGSARVQTVARQDNPTYWNLIKSFEQLTGVPMVVNTSFNDNEEPIVCTPADAIRCFHRTDLDGLAIGPFYVRKAPATALEIAA
jgi:carbamoyltransferase